MVRFPEPTGRVAPSVGTLLSLPEVDLLSLRDWQVADRSSGAVLAVVCSWEVCP